jgi:hypothetical protein
MSYTYLLEQGEESSAESFSDIPASVLSRSRSIPEKSYCNVSETESYRDSRSGTTYKHSMADHGAGASMSCVEGFHARTSARPEKERESTVAVLDCGERCGELSVRYDRERSSWKTHLCLWDEDLPESLVTLPKCGMAQDGVCWALDISELGISVKDSGWWLPTICKSESKGSGRSRYIGSSEYRGAKMSEGLRTCKTDPIYLNPSFGEIAMGFPPSWTELQPLETRSVHRWLQLHGKF